MNRLDPHAKHAGFVPGGAKEHFVLPRGEDGAPLLYFCGHSLGLQPLAVASEIQGGLNAWGTLAVDGHFEGARPWFSLGEDLRPKLARLVGASEDAVALHASLTTNLHLLLTSFYRPHGRRTKLLIEHGAFPSDRFLAHSHVRARDLDPAEHVLEIRGEGSLGVPSTDEVIAAIDDAGETLATVLLPGVSFSTGTAYDLRRISEAAHRVGASVGFDLAHAAGNLALDLEGSGADFAAWCSYKYLNAGPGAIAGLFVHPRHTQGEPLIPRLEGWWGNRASTRFTPNTDFEPDAGASAWLLSNVPVFSALPLYASLPIFDTYGMDAIAEAGKTLQRALREGLERSGADVEILSDTRAHGAQLSIAVPGRAEAIQTALQQRGLVCDTRGPDVLRFGAVPLYTSLEDVARAVDLLTDTLRRG